MSPLGLLEVLDHLEDAGIRLGVADRDGAVVLVTEGPLDIIDPDLGAAIRHHKVMLINVVICRGTGHAPAPCTSCGEVTFTPPLKADGKARETWPTCRFTPGCDGRHQPRARDVARTKPNKPPAQAAAPAYANPHLLGPVTPWPSRESRP